MSDGRDLTPTQRKALKALAQNGGDGVRTNRRTLLAAGVELGHGEDGGGADVEAFSWTTWAKLRDLGYLEAYAPKRLRLTAAGVRVAER